MIKNVYLQVLSWEALRKDEGSEPKLKSFGGKVLIQFGRRQMLIGL